MGLMEASEGGAATALTGAGAVSVVASMGGGGGTLRASSALFCVPWDESFHLPFPHIHNGDNENNLCPPTTLGVRRAGRQRAEG